MLCSLKNKRPDKMLNKVLLALAYSLVALTASIVLFFVYPEHFSALILLVLFMLIICIYLSIKTINAGEEAISYGGFANEIIESSREIRRIDNADGEPVIQNALAKDFLKNQNILKFLEENLSNNPNNKIELQNLKNLIDNLLPGTVGLSLNLKKDNKTVFESEDWFEISIKPIYLRKTNIFEKPFSVEKIKKDTYIFWNMDNVTNKKDMDSIFQEELNDLHDSIDYLPVGLYICNSNYDIEYCNHAFARIAGADRDELINKNLKDLLTENSAVPPKSSSWQGRLFLRNINNEVVNCYISQAGFRHKGQIKIRSVAFEHLPNEKKIQGELDNVLDSISWLFDNSPYGTVFIDRNFNIIKGNEAAESFFNVEKNSLGGVNFLSYIDNEDADRFRNTINNAGNGKDIDITAVINNTKKAATLHIITMKKVHSLKNNSADYEGWVIYINDATKQKELELQFAQAQKMQAMGQLAGGIAHDFNNLLTAMIGFCDLLLQRHGVGDPSFADLIQIKQNANRAAGLVRQLLAFSRKQPLKPKLIDVAENFLEINHMLKRILGENVNIHFHHNDNLGFIKVDPVQFSQVIINLAVNAKDAMDAKGSLSITTRVEDLKKPYQFGEDTIQPGEFVVIDVKDTGSGIAPENISRIFEPFFSTKQNIVGSGTGLGLAMVYGIVRQTGGFIKVESKLGTGTIFSIYLPRFEQNDEDEDIEKETNNIAQSIITVKERINPSVNISQKLILGLNVSTIDKKTENKDFDASKIRILFVEDEDSVRAFAIRALKKKGYDVIACDSAETALEQLEKDTNFNLLITDMVMPGMNGAELAKIAKEKIKNLKIILASGYSEEMAKKELSQDDHFEFMAKPFSLGDLTQKVFDVLNSN